MGRPQATALQDCGYRTALGVVEVFWGTADYAQALGRRLAVTFEQKVPYMPRAEVYSLKPLGIGSDAVKQVKVGSGETALYRYSGLRLLVLSGGRFFFLHDGWTPWDGTVIVLPDDNSVRIEFKRYSSRGRLWPLGNDAGRRWRRISESGIRDG